MIRKITVFILTWWLSRPRRTSPAGTPVPGRLLYVAANCLPYHLSGYTTRTDAVVRAMRDSGIDIQVVTRPGYPWDRSDRRADSSQNVTIVDDMEYRHFHFPPNYLPVVAYAFVAARPIIAHARREKIAVIHAASNHVNALPALLAARKLGIPFHYELRGIWEITRISRMPEFEGSEAYLQGLALEGLVARNADTLFVISEQLGRYAQQHWGVPAERIRLLPNCVDPERIFPAEQELTEANTIAYAGSLMSYEGLDTLIDAVHILVKNNTPVHVDIIGDGEVKASLEAQTQQLGLSAHIRFHGKLPPETTRALLGGCSLVCIPRKPFKVCEIVPPIKLVEALAMAKPVIVPDLPVFRDELGNNPAGWLFKAGDPVDLARIITIALGNPEQLKTLSARARQYAQTQRRWQDFIVKPAATLASLSQTEIQQ
ncbi:Glycosyltransferase involved in cell wall bisynthesis [Methylobacillus rhizosphaerae]|uniref:Glycosyltransferase involved in cell wall bisynthesis n=1 Tax=Methylobacillus rhizosphaerae TaxID=551994 RepID=A0A238XKS3_9PROT|nr:glycosyltransferase family 4 protein [Methylobacillus rhizosphaerae]SNR59595.1 Glycosyltransferase involved in cell wall bisynthesis [Methylobacillus rhizosphaerae]